MRMPLPELRDHGVTPINWTTVAAELQRNWTLPTGQGLGRVLHDHYPSYGLLMDSFESVTASAVEAWASYCEPKKAGNVVQIGSRTRA